MDKKSSSNTQTTSRSEFWVLAALLALGGTWLARLAAAPTASVTISSYATSLHGRTRGQRLNARLAALALNGKVVKPGEIFSFNRTVNSWSSDQGYVKAPVSFDGELVRAYGGGVCQTSTTLYNAALLAGLPIIERHPHVFRPHYIAPGRDAAVAYPGIDLRFRNPHRWPLRIKAACDGDSLEVSLLGAERSPGKVQILSEFVGVSRPSRLTRRLHGKLPRRRYLMSPGDTGYRVVTYRTFVTGSRVVRRERLADDSYPAMNRVTVLAGD